MHHSPSDSMKEESIGDSIDPGCLKAMEAILARRFAPFDFSGIPGFPNVVPTMHEWGDYLLRFRGDDHDHPVQHLIDFHQYMDQLDIHHEDVLLKMFMYSLEGEARQ
jgi:hypothetical protein